MQLICSTDDYSLQLVRVELHVALSDISGTCGKNRQSYSCVVDTRGEVELRVIGVLVVVNTMVIDHVSSPALEL